MRQGRAVPGVLASRPFRRQSTATGQPAKLNQAQVDGLLSAIPPYFSQDVITPDRREATLAFGIRLMSLQRQQQLIEEMRATLHPPAGVSAAARRAAGAGGPVGHAGRFDPWRRAGDAPGRTGRGRPRAAARLPRGPRRALVPLVPIVLASGWSALVLFAVGVPLNPMSVTLGALVIAISTEFSVLLSERYRQERAAGHDAIEALAGPTVAPAPPCWPPA